MDKRLHKKEIKENSIALLFKLKLNKSKLKCKKAKEKKQMSGSAFDMQIDTKLRLYIKFKYF